MASGEYEVIRQIQSGQPDAFAVLYERYVDQVFAFILYKTQHRETAQDITSRVFTNALEHIGSLKADDHAFRPWIYTIARNAIIDHYRTQRPQVDISDAWDIAGDDDVERDADLRGQLDKVRKYLAQLDATQRDIVLLRVWQDMTYADIAKIVGKSPDNCKMIFSRVVRKMRADLVLLLMMAVLRSHL